MKKHLLHISCAVLCLAIGILTLSCQRESDRSADTGNNYIALNGHKKPIVCAYMSNEDLTDHETYTLILAASTLCEGSETIATLRNFVQISVSAETQQATSCTAFRYVDNPETTDEEYVAQLFDTELLTDIKIDFEVIGMAPLTVSVAFEADNVEMENFTGNDTSVTVTLSGSYKGTVKTEPVGSAFWYTRLSDFSD